MTSSSLKRKDRVFFGMVYASILIVIGTECLGSCKSNYHTITTAQQEE
jgi:hypothetical protein